MRRATTKNKTAPVYVIATANPKNPTGHTRAAGPWLDIEDARTAARARAKRTGRAQQVYRANPDGSHVRPIGKRIPPHGLEVTDRAYRYRANANPPPGPKICHFCGADKGIMVAHVNGKEEDNRRQNQAHTCRSCNVLMSNIMARAGQGRKTRQYNPQGASSYAQYVRLILIMRGEIDGDGTTPAEARDAIEATPADKRSEYAHRIWQTRRKRHGPTGRQDSIPF